MLLLLTQNKYEATVRKAFLGILTSVYPVGNIHYFLPRLWNCRFMYSPFFSCPSSSRPTSLTDCLEFRAFEPYIPNENLAKPYLTYPTYLTYPDLPTYLTYLLDPPTWPTHLTFPLEPSKSEHITFRIRWFTRPAGQTRTDRQTELEYLDYLEYQDYFNNLEYLEIGLNFTILADFHNFIQISQFQPNM